MGLIVASLLRGVAAAVGVLVEFVAVVVVALFCGKGLGGAI